MGMPRPGEVSLAHNGVLFLDEFPEFPRNVLEMLRQPLEDGSVTIARSNMTLSFPLELHAGGRHEPLPVRLLRRRHARVPLHARRIIQRYLGKISGPLLDRIDLHVEVPAVPYKELRGDATAESSAEIRARVERARAMQQARGFYNCAHARRAMSASSARWTMPASAPWRWPCAAWAFPPAPTTAS